MAPVHADEVDGAVEADIRHIGEYRLQEVFEFGRAHLARRHLEFAMLDRAETADMTVDRNIVGRIGEYHPRLLAIH